MRNYDIIHTESLTTWISNQLHICKFQTRSILEDPCIKIWNLTKSSIKEGSVSKYLHLPFLPSLHPFHLGHPSQVPPWDPWPQVIQGVLGSHQAPLDQGDYKRAVRCGWWCFGLSLVTRIVTGSRRVTANTTPHTSATWWSLWSNQKQRIWVSGCSHKVLIQTR